MSTGIWPTKSLVGVVQTQIENVGEKVDTLVSSCYKPTLPKQNGNDSWVNSCVQSGNRHVSEMLSIMQRNGNRLSLCQTSMSSNKNAKNAYLCQCELRRKGEGILKRQISTGPITTLSLRRAQYLFAHCNPTIRLHSVCPPPQWERWSRKSWVQTWTRANCEGNSSEQHPFHTLNYRDHEVRFLHSTLTHAFCLPY